MPNRRIAGLFEWEGFDAQWRVRIVHNVHTRRPPKPLWKVLLGPTSEHDHFSKTDLPVREGAYISVNPAALIVSSTLSSLCWFVWATEFGWIWDSDKSDWFRRLRFRLWIQRLGSSSANSPTSRGLRLLSPSVSLQQSSLFFCMCKHRPSRSQCSTSSTTCGQLLPRDQCLQSTSLWQHLKNEPVHWAQTWFEWRLSIKPKECSFRESHWF